MTVRVFASMPLLIFGIFAFAAGLLILILPETLGKESPATIADCEQGEEGEAVEMKTIHEDAEEAPLSEDREAAQGV